MRSVLAGGFWWFAMIPIAELKRIPSLYAPVHFAFTSALKAKNLVLLPLVKYAGYKPRSLSDRGQDLWVLEVLEHKRGGFFLDLGAADGFSESNTYVLEKRHGWSGICIEPNPVLFDLLTRQSNRTCNLVSDVVDDEDGEVEFVLSGQESELIALETDNNETSRGSLLAKKRKEGTVRLAPARTLASILDACEAPKTIDYFSFDVEDAETRILRHFPFDRYTFLGAHHRAAEPRAKCAAIPERLLLRQELALRFVLRAWQHCEFRQDPSGAFRANPAKAILKPGAATTTL